MNKKKQAIYDEEELEVGRMWSKFKQINEDVTLSNKQRSAKINRLIQEVRDNRVLWMATRHKLPMIMLSKAKERL